MEILLTENKHDGNIFTLSDIHGDIHSFIISLRDCAKVIRKVSLDLTKLDPDIDRNLQIDISEDDEKYQKYKKKYIQLKLKLKLINN